MKKAVKLIKIVISICSIAGVIAFIVERISSDETNHKPYGIYEKFLKRPLDCFLAAGALIVLSPVLIIISLLVRVKLGSPVIFKQERPGKDEKIFTLYKFRTMTDEKDSEGNLLPDADRLTPFGKWLRSTSLDELPELYNIVKGDMAIVGPRPLLVEYLDRYNEEQKHRHDTRPGLTGYAQINGRNALSWEDKFEMDVCYTKRITFRGDVGVVLNTIKTVMRQDGISEDGEATMSEFLGDVIK